MKIETYMQYILANSLLSGLCNRISAICDANSSMTEIELKRVLDPLRSQRDAVYEDIKEYEQQNVPID